MRWLGFEEEAERLKNSVLNNKIFAADRMEPWHERQEVEDMIQNLDLISREGKKLCPAWEISDISNKKTNLTR